MISAADLRENLRLLSDMEKKVAQDLLESKRKDDVRGPKIIDDYADVHPPAEEDSFVREVMGLAEGRRKEIRKLLRLIPSSR